VCNYQLEILGDRNVSTIFQTVADQRLLDKIGIKDRRFSVSSSLEERAMPPVNMLKMIDTRAKIAPYA
jgi:hypothetical protein